ncbi:hypothetical protein EDD37DRAFT_138490 [Exophiala viscosa]|uniref:DUF6604 domain-containing protein n=1 Tax=Exophiala viscosa TaxID=2486360 RepID=A0AAN6DMB8_9EURO|nr:hypothetical protein EDD36DRAFT_83657 [Exophiala viscosa]KAI1620931.1 hypothetical protein EDD37DRAFT_138490 [Exophiala viscosa]
MLPEYLTTSYRRCKQDADYLATWLATTAKQCGHVINSRQAAPPSTEKSQKLKGRARTLARRAAREYGGSTTTVGQNDGMKKQTYTVAIKEFVPMARRVAVCVKPVIKNPRRFANVLERAISLRKRISAAVIDGQTPAIPRNADDQCSDLQHSYFINILEQVRDILGIGVPVRSETDAMGQGSCNTDSKPEIDFVNLFECLDIEEPAEELENQDKAPAGRTKQPPQELSVLYTTETVSDCYESFFAFACLLRDLKQMRDTVNQTWIGFKTHKYDVVTAALTANAAMELARRLEEDMDEFSANGGPGFFLEAFHCAGWAQLRALSIASCLSGEEVEAAGCRLGTDLFWSTYERLQWYVGTIAENSVADRKKTIVYTSPGQHGRYEPLRDRSKMSLGERVQEDHFLLGDIFPDLSIWALLRREMDIPGDDEFTRGFCQVCETGEVPLWFVFASQIFLDVHHILREKVELGYEILIVVGGQIGKSIIDNFKYQEEVLQQKLPTDIDRGFTALLKFVETLGRLDPIEDFHARCVEHMPQLSRLNVEKNHMLKIHPILCGLKVFTLRAQYREFSLQLANSQPHILACAHLHNALYREGLVYDQWKDIIFFMTSQDRDCLFAGSPPTEAIDYHSRYSLAVSGHSASNYARNRRRPDNVVMSATGHRKIQSQIPILDMFINRYCEDKYTNLAPQDVIQILGASRWASTVLTKEQAENWPSAPLARGRNMEVHMLVPKSGQNPFEHQSPLDQKSSVSELLRTLRGSLHSENVSMSFDYLQMHHHSTQLLQAISDETRDVVRDSLGQTFTGRRAPLELVASILACTSATSRGARNVGLPDSMVDYRAIARQLLISAAQQVKNLTGETVETVIGAKHKRGEAVMAFMKFINRIDYIVDSEDPWFTGVVKV